MKGFTTQGTTRQSDFIVIDGTLHEVAAANVALDGEGFYVSYNNYDIATYGADTTALVWGQMQAFYILNGDHRTEYARLIPQGWGACFAYFNANQEQANKHSDFGEPAEVIAKFRERLYKKE